MASALILSTKIPKNFCGLENPRNGNFNRAAGIIGCDGERCSEKAADELGKKYWEKKAHENARSTKSSQPVHLEKLKQRVFASPQFV